MARALEVEKEVWCLGCGESIGPGEGVMLDEYWWLCRDCAVEEPDAPVPHFAGVVIAQH
ncbi:MAG: hypothetical protein ACRDJU_00785 [Actinomycetota bacterium]